MGQWGKSYRVNGAEFLAHLDTGGAWQPRNPHGDDRIDKIININSSGDEQRDIQTEYHLNKIFVGKKEHELDSWYQEHQDSAVLHIKRPDSPWARVPEGPSNGK